MAYFYSNCINILAFALFAVSFYIPKIPPTILWLAGNSNILFYFPIPAKNWYTMFATRDAAKINAAPITYGNIEDLY